MITLEDVLQNYGLNEEFPEQWVDSKDTSALAQLRDSSNNSENSGALVDEILGSMTRNNNVSEDEFDPLGTGTTILNALKVSGKMPKSKKDLLAYMPNSTAFNARKFLRDVHSAASLEDLQLGLTHLKENIAGKDQGLRSMVDIDYEKYVASKRRLDDVMNQIGQFEMDNASSYGFKELQMKLEFIQNRLNMCERPISGVSKEKKQLEAALEGIKENRELLELPGILETHLKANDHEKFIREYKYRKKQLTALSESSNTSARQLSVFITKRIRSIIDRYRSNVTERLMRAGPDEAYSSLLAKLIDLGVSEDVLVSWLETIYKNFNTDVKQCFESLNNVEYNEIVGKLFTVEFNAYLSTFSATDGVQDILEWLECKSNVDCEPVMKQWAFALTKFEELRAVLTKAASFCREFLSLSTDSMFPAKWKLSQAQINDILTQNKSLVLVTAESLDTMTFNWVPRNKNSFSCSNFLVKILDVLTSMLPPAQDLVNAASSPLDSAVLRAKGQFIKHLCDSWINDSAQIGKIKQYNITCDLPPIFSLYHRVMIEQLRFLMDINRGGPASIDLMRHSTEAFSAAIRASLQSLDSSVVTAKLQNPVSTQLEPTIANQDTLILSALSNVEKLWNNQLPEIFERFELSFRQPQLCEQARNEVDLEINRIRDQLFEVFIRKKRSLISLTVNQELAKLYESWSVEPLKEITNISNYVYECLMILVEAHALFTESCPQLTRDAISELYLNLLSSMQMMLGKFDTLSRRGTLQCIADLEFMRWALSHYKECQNNCQLVFAEIKKVSVDDSIWTAAEGPRSLVMPVLESSIRRSQFSFTCFKE